MPDVPESPDLLCLLAMPRTGSSYVSVLFDAHPQFQSHTELFHREAVFLRVADRAALLPELARIARARSADIFDPALVAWARKFPRALLEFLSERRERRFLTFKVFPRHLSDDQLDPVHFDSPRIACLLLERHPLATYVSQLKARRTREFSHRDTSDLTVDADPAEFVEFVATRARWYERCRRALAARGKPVVTLTYESLASASEANALAMLVEAARAIGLNDVEDASLDGARLRPKQDRRAPHESIGDWPKFAAEVAERGLGDLLSIGI